MTKAIIYGVIAAASLLALNTNAQAGKPPTNQPPEQKSPLFANQFDRALAGQFEARERDWRNGAVVYQVLVDRFAPSATLADKKSLYPSPKILRRWDELPQRGTYLLDAQLWSHEIDFWGGDLESLNTKLDYIKSLNADVLYLNPVHHAYTNHKYDALDYMQVSPEFGTREDVKKLAASVHGMGMKMVLDGVFNHMGHHANIFKEAKENANSKYRDWFVFGAQFKTGARVWDMAESLPELNLENQAVRNYIYAKRDSVVQSYLRDGVDGWRLDVARDIGFNFLSELTQAAHKQKPGSLIVGEIANYPKEWFPSVDGVMNFTLREIILQTVLGKIDAQTSTRMVSRIIDDAGIEPMLKSWTMLDNHDTFRLATVVPNEAQRKLAQVLQFTLPGSPNLYYGSEVGMTGGDDPEMRAPMRWDLANPTNATLRWTQQLINLHKKHRALRVGNFRTITANKLLAFERYTDRVEDSVIVIANPTNTEVNEIVLVPNSKLMDNRLMINLMADSNSSKASAAANALAGTMTPAAPASPVKITAALLNVVVPAHGFLVLQPEIHPDGGYSAYKRVQ